MRRLAITIRGIVQGVGFRPYVYGLAQRYALGGFVCNRSGEVRIEIEGESAAIDGFLADLRLKAPPLARIEHVWTEPISPMGERDFRIAASDSGPANSIMISADVATCDDCLSELFEPADRRFGYPFLNCTNCGPRLTIIQSAPYDRARTTMSSFAMCDACRCEYEDPANRRFHAQPTACASCGPALSIEHACESERSDADPLEQFASAIERGEIGAIKGLGGYHLVCDATNTKAVSRLRERKHREEKPLAIMVADVEAARRFCDVNVQERKLLESPRGLIVLLRRTTVDLLTNSAISPAVAPDNPFLGVMLPYTPLHHLLMRRLSNRPVVMTSGNATDEPIAYQNEDARSRLSGIADIFLTHNRPIRVRADDSIVRVNDGNQQIVRRSRGFAPEPILLPIACDTPTLAVGGQFKSVFAHGRDRHAILSHHLGDLDHYDAYQAFERDVRLYERLFEVTPQRIVHDLHPDYGSTGYATRRASDEFIERLGVQHHHAHMASCMAEHGLTESVIGVVWDGAGYGLDGAIWGGEMLVGDYTGFVRAAHFRYVRLPGGDRAVREPWRIAIAHLRDADCPNSDRLAISPSQSRLVERMIARGFNAPFTSSVGRLFDAVAALIGLRDEVSYEGQAAMQLEWLATQSDDRETYPIELTEDGSRPVGIGRLPPVSNSLPFGNSPENAFARDWQTFPFVIDTRPLIRSVVEDMYRETLLSTIARRFHSSLVDAIVAGCERIRQTTAIATVVLSGGVFLNTILSREAPQRLRAAGFRVYCQQLVPPGDGGLCLGQLAVAACQNKMALDRDD